MSHCLKDTEMLLFNYLHLACFCNCGLEGQVHELN